MANSGTYMRNRGGRILFVAGCSLCASFLLPVLLLRFALDWIAFPVVDNGMTHEIRRLDVVLPMERSILVRQYGRPDFQRCAIFFPGQHGGIPTYELTLFPEIERLGIAVFALSYPGQDGAVGRNRVATLFEDTNTAVTTITEKTSCGRGNTVFVGRSQGATLAVYAAQRTRPKGLLLDGVGPNLTSAVRAMMRRRTVTFLWSLLPLRLVVKNDYELLPLVRSLRPIPIAIFQGTEDDVTPFEDARKTLSSEANVRFVAVPGANHSNAYLLAMPEYASALTELFGTNSLDTSQ